MSVTGAQKGLLPPRTDSWARDRGASVANRGLTLTPVTLSSYAGPLLSRNGRGLRDPYDHLRPAFPLKKSLLFISYDLALLAETRLTVHRVDRLQTPGKENPCGAEHRQRGR